MKKNRINAFTLVEMLIVIVIIGILIAALLPRMSAAQWRARDVSRKTALSQIQSAIVTYQWDFWSRPGQDDARWAWTGVAALESELLGAWMTEVPKDPLNSTFSWIWTSTVKDYGYVVAKRNSVYSGWFALMAKTEVAWSSNWVVCTGGTGQIKSDTDLKDIHPCSSVIETGAGGCTNPNAANADNKCYGTLEEMRYIILY